MCRALRQVLVPTAQPLGDLVDEDVRAVRVDGHTVQGEVLAQLHPIHLDQITDGHGRVQPRQQLDSRACVVVRERRNTCVGGHDVERLNGRLVDASVELHRAVVDAFAEVAHLQAVGLEALLQEPHGLGADAVDFRQALLGEEQNRRDAAREQVVQLTDDRLLGLVGPHGVANDEFLDGHEGLAVGHGDAFHSDRSEHERVSCHEWYYTTLLIKSKCTNPWIGTLICAGAKLTLL